MAVIVEDGTGVAGANSYVSAADCGTYATARGLTFTPDGTGDSALIRATTWLDATYINYWPGVPTLGRSQDLQWPRYDVENTTEVTDVDGNTIAKDEIPVEVIDALCEAAIIEQANPGTLSPSVIPGQKLKSASVYQAVEVEYWNSNGGVDDTRPVPTVVDDILSGLIGLTRGPDYHGMTSRG